MDSSTDKHGGMWHCLFAAVVVLFAAGAAEACSVPVYRWALERWAAEPYVLRVVDAGDEARGLDPLRQCKSANLIVEEEEAREGGHGGRFELLYPAGVAGAPAMEGGVEALDAAALLDSPVRRELVRRLLDGQSAVWLLVKCGDRAKDQAVAAVLGEQIAVANRTLRLPDLAGEPVLDAPGAPNVANLRVEFSMLEVSRADDAEAVLLRMLLGSEPDLAQTAEPVAFPVFGRGRVLYALVGPGICPEMIMKACVFIVGPCACEIKSDNPGFDLLLDADWESGAGGVKLAGRIDLPPLPGTALASRASIPQDRAANTAVVRNVAAAVSGVVVLVGVASVVLSRRLRVSKNAGNKL
ncbi:MAG: hypothetical protein NTZ09_16995 [Candidatus Hydrogenedentes bacterium]|nr:hypothetical protein [Candidatus Hydrogenedentota bacterium]